MKINSLIKSILLFACIDAIVVPPKNIMKFTAGSADDFVPQYRPDPPGNLADGPSEPGPVVDRPSDPPGTVANSGDDAQIEANPAHFIPQFDVYKDKMTKLSFHDAYRFSLNIHSQYSPKSKIRDFVSKDVSLFHDANLDGQYALRGWLDMAAGEEKASVLRNLLENPTVDPRKLDSLRTEKAFDQVIALGDLDNVRILYDKLELKPGDYYSRDLAIKAAKHNELAIFKYLLDEKKVDFSDYKAASQVQTAAALSGNKDLLKHLLEGYTLPDGTRLKADPRIQYFAVSSGNKDVIKYLLEGYLRPDGSRLPAHNKVQFWAAKSGNLDVVKYLLEDYSPNGARLAMDPRIQFSAAESGNRELVKYLLEGYTFPNGAKVKTQSSIQLYAASSGNLDLVKYLLEDFKLADGTKLAVDPIIQLKAARSGNLDLVKYLLEDYTLPDGSKLKLLPEIRESAAQSGNMDLVRYVTG